MTEAELERAVLDLAGLLGWRRLHVRPAMNAKGRWRTPVSGDGKGFPDLLLIRGQNLVVAELKSESGRLTREQVEWLWAFHRSDHPAMVWKPEDWTDGSIERFLRQEVGTGYPNRWWSWLKKAANLGIVKGEA